MNGWFTLIPSSTFLKNLVEPSFGNLLTSLAVNTCTDLIVLTIGYLLFVYRKIVTSEEFIESTSFFSFIGILPTILVHAVLVIIVGFAVDAIALKLVPAVSFVWEYGYGTASVISLFMFFLIALVLLFILNLLASFIVLKLTCGSRWHQDMFNPFAASLRIAALIAFTTNPVWLAIFFTIIANSLGPS